MPSLRLFVLLIRFVSMSLLFSACGCFQLETLVQIHEDGSATITERFQVSQRILDLEKAASAENKMSGGLVREATLERLKLMGTGTTLVSHAIREVDGGSRESVSVFKIPDAMEFQYASPYLALPGYRGQCLMKGKALPRLHNDNYNPPGYVYFSFEPAVSDPAQFKEHQTRARARQSEPPPKGPSPAELQLLRQIQPIIRDMLQGVKLRFTIESYGVMYAGWGAPGVRHGSSSTRRLDLIDVSDKNLDAFGVAILDNEEIMLELQQLQFDGPNLRQHLEGYIGNLTLPLLLRRVQPAIFKPSQTFFDRLYTGKTIDFGQRRGGARPAKFDEIGWRPEPSAAKP